MVLPSAFSCVQQLQHFAAAGGVEAGSGLVEHDQLGIAEQRLRDADALHHAARVLADLQILVAVELHLRE